jgi:hypothetical protein
MTRIIRGKSVGGAATQAPIITLADAPTISWNASISNRAQVFIASNRTLVITNAPTNVPLLLQVQRQGNSTLTIQSYQGLIRLSVITTLLLVNQQVRVGEIGMPTRVYCPQNITSFRPGRTVSVTNLVHCQQDLNLFRPARTVTPTSLTFCQQDINQFSRPS